MKKIIVACFAALLLVFGGVSSAQADEYLRVGMEAAYAPFNWTQDDDSNGAVPIEGTKQYANGYDVQIAKKIAQTQGKKPLDRFDSCPHFRQDRYDYRWYESNS